MPAISAQPNDYNDYSNLNMNFKIDGKFKIEATGEDANIKDVKTYLTFFTQNDYLQKVGKIKYYSTPQAQINHDTQEVLYTWENPSLGNFNFGVEAEVTVENAIVIIDEKIPFPIETKDTYYTSPSEFIDITPEIKAKAQEIAAGEDDLYFLAFKVADWVEQNIKYDLNTLTADAVQKSSWVLQNKEGVCDELTNLFISMMRSLGIPARFISGTAYTNLGNKWGPHGWAEVYFPDKGWVPFDVTYRQFGWLDPSHIKLKVSADSGESTVRYSWRSAETNLVGKEINLDTSIISTGEKLSKKSPPIKFQVKSLVNNVGPGSYVPVEVEIVNNHNYYFPVFFTVTKATELTERNIKSVLLKPGETKKVFWITKIPEDIERGYIYTSTVEIEDQFHISESAEVVYSKNFNIISQEEAESLISSSQQVEKKVLSKRIDIDCKGPSYKFSYEDIQIKCKLKNKGNTNLKDIKTCYKKNCQFSDLGIAEEKDIEFKLNLEPAIHNIEIIASTDSLKATDIVTTNVLKSPDLKIVSINYPEIVNYKDDFNITMTLIVEAPIKDVKIIINDENVINLKELEISKVAIIMAKGKNFFDKNEINIKIEFKDLNNKIYKTESSYPIQVRNVPWYIKIVNFLFGINKESRIEALVSKKSLLN